MLKHTWLPASTPNPSTTIKIDKAMGSHLILDTGQKIYDGISSWWCKPLGHSNLIIKNSIYAQLEQFEHHIPANAYNNSIEQLSTTLTSMYNTMSKVMYASDGSSAIEIAMKLSYEYRVLTNTPQKNRFLALKNAYHGETIFTLSVCGIDSYKKAYSPFLYENYFIDDIPYINSTHDQLWSHYNHEDNLEKFISSIAPVTTALIIEPIVQGATGLKFISKSFLIKLINLAHKYNLHVIADEIMVGLGRLGNFTICKEIIGIEPDIVCVAKNLTAGAIPMSAVIINKQIVNAFDSSNVVFPHSHTHSCNALASNVANTYLNYISSINLQLMVARAELNLFELFNNLSAKYSFISNPRAMGAIGACEVNLDSDHINQIYNIGIEHGIYLRPIGKNLYVMPPLYNLDNDMNEIYDKVELVVSKLI